MNRQIHVVFVELSTQDVCHLFNCFLHTINCITKHYKLAQ